MNPCAVGSCYQPASWSPWWELWLCVDCLAAIDAGDPSGLPPLDDPRIDAFEHEQALTYMDGEDPEPCTSEWIVAALKALAPA